MKKLLTLTLLALALNCSAQYSQNKYHNMDKKTHGIEFIISGLTFTAGGLAEGGYSYGTGSPFSTPYKIPPFIVQTPRNLCVAVGVTFTIIGLFELINK